MQEFISLAEVALTAGTGIVFITAGVYSLAVNKPQAATINHKREEKLALYSGWMYIAIGVAVIGGKHFISS